MSEQWVAEVPVCDSGIFPDSPKELCRQDIAGWSAGTVAVGDKLSLGRGIKTGIPSRLRASQQRRLARAKQA